MINKVIRQHFTINYTYEVHFTHRVFDVENITLKNVLKVDNGEKKILLVIDSGVTTHFPHIKKYIYNYFETNIRNVSVCDEIIEVPGGEEAKNALTYVEKLTEAVNRHGIDRHSYIMAIGGGAVIDMVGYVAATAHRGIRLLRIPTTVLAQNDAAIGVKNSINYKNKKNFLGTFATPFAVINDFDFLQSLSDRDWRAGVAEAVKVALIKDKDFFYYIAQACKKLIERNDEVMQQIIIRCAALHLQHISSGDPFETGSSRPLDFGHWSAHKLEQLSHFSIKHGEAVAIGMALDTVYSHLCGLLDEAQMNKVLNVLHDLGFELKHEMLDTTENDGTLSILNGLKEFREHLGGILTIMLLKDIGQGHEVNDIDTVLMSKAIHFLIEKY